MNYLAHIFLSGNDKSVQVGNFIGDFVKGSQYQSYPVGLRKGILLHRDIDSFTDTHSLVRGLVAFLRPEFGRYSGIVVDMYFDYFLAVYFSEFSGGKSLRGFSCEFYVAALVRYVYLPQRVQGFIFHFASTNRLVRYASYEGLKESLSIMARYKVSALDPERIIQFLKLHREEVERVFRAFLPELRRFVNEKAPHEARL